MATTALLVILGNLVFVLTCGTIGLHLIRLSRRTGRSPELLLGLGLIFIVMGISMLRASGMGRATVSEVSIPLIAAGNTALALSILFQGAFVCRTFRPGRRWAIALASSLGLAELGITAEIVHALVNSAPDTPEVVATHWGVFLIRGPLAACYGWTAIEGFLQFRMAQRRQKLGIGDAILTNRFLLFCVMGVLSCANAIISSALHRVGMTPFSHPVSAAFLGLGSAMVSLVLLLAFLPPVRYLDWIRTRQLPS
jgi:hypothetical protein